MAFSLTGAPEIVRVVRLSVSPAVFACDDLVPAPRAKLRCLIGRLEAAAAAGNHSDFGEFANRRATDKLWKQRGFSSFWLRRGGKDLKNWWFVRHRYA